jgi:hypothetical protein
MLQRYQQLLQWYILLLRRLDKKLYDMKRYNILRKRYNVSFIFWLVLALLTLLMTPVTHPTHNTTRQIQKKKTSRKKKRRKIIKLALPNSGTYPFFSLEKRRNDVLNKGSHLHRLNETLKQIWEIVWAFII